MPMGDEFEQSRLISMPLISTIEDELRLAWQLYLE
jgi:hypothetical protein